MKRFGQAIVAVLVFSMLLPACRQAATDKQTGTHLKQADESLVKANRYLVRKEKEEIDSFISRHGWQMQETGSGLQFSLVESGNGPEARRGQTAVLAYTLRLITGDVIYSSEKDGLKSFVIGHGGVESGLEEAVLLMKQGDKARVIIPSHLAFGLLGDDKKIPPRATLIYELELIELK